MFPYFIFCLILSVSTCNAFVNSYKSQPYESRMIPLSCHTKNVKLAFVGGSLLLTTPSFAQDTNAEGEQVFYANCAGCHAGGKNVVVADHTLEKAAIEKYLQGGFNEKSIVHQITNGKNAMPAFKERLSDIDISNVASYVLRTAEDGWE